MVGGCHVFGGSFLNCINIHLDTKEILAKTPKPSLAMLRVASNVQREGKIVWLVGAMFLGVPF